MRRPVLLATISLLAMSVAGQAFAEDVNLWVRTSSAAVVQGLADKFNADRCRCAAGCRRHGPDLSANLCRYR